MKSGTWTIVEAKAKFSELVDQARAGGPQTVTKNGRSAVIVVSVEEWERKTRRTGNLAEFLANSPLRDADLDLSRAPDDLREVDL